MARAKFGTKNVDHHRTADYAGLIEALGEKAPRAMATMGQLAEAKAILLIGNDPTEQNPLVGWQIRSAIRQHGARLYAINARNIKLRRKAKLFVQVTPGEEAAALLWLARREGAPRATLAADL